MSAAPHTSLARRTRPRLAVVAPSGVFDAASFERGIARLREVADVHVPSRLLQGDLHASPAYLAGSDAERAQELTEALMATEVDFILAARGGYGATRILDLVDRAAVARAGRPVVGFSDVTALHALWRQAGVPSLHGPNVTGLGTLSDGDFASFMAALEGAPAALPLGTPLVAGDAEGPLVGGNLAVLTALVGTPHALDVRGAILLLEDVHERPYRVDRMLTTMLAAGALAGVRAIVLGDFLRCDPGADGTTVTEVIRERLGGLGVPLYLGAPIGHGDRNHTVPLGNIARLHGGALHFDGRSLGEPTPRR